MEDYEIRDVELRIEEGRRLADDIGRAFGLDGWQREALDALEGLASVIHGERRAASTTTSAITLPDDFDRDLGKAISDRVGAFKHEVNELAVILPIEIAADRDVVAQLSAVIAAFARLENALLASLA